MSLKDKINSDLKAAMKAKDQAALRSIRAIKAAIMLAETDGSGNEVDDDRMLKIVQKLIKQRQDSLAIYQEQGRDDLALTEQEEIAVISRYLPEQLSEEEVGKIIDDIIASTGAAGMKDMGRVMGAATGKIKGKADNKMIAAMVKTKLQSM